MSTYWPCILWSSAKALIDKGSTLNFFPMATLDHLNVHLSLIQPSTMIIRAFDGICQKVQGEIELMMEVGPKSLMVNFKMIEVDSLYNILLERSWFHVASAIPSTLHWKLNFIFENQLVTIHKAFSF